MSNPIQNPKLDDTFVVDALTCPGLARITSGGSREEEWQEGQTPGQTGASMIFRLEHIARITYGVELWTVAQFTAWEPFIAALMAGKNQRPPKVWKLQDPRVAHNGINLLAFASCGPRRELAPGKWGYELAFVEKPKSKPIGGAVKAPKSAVEAKIDALSAANASLQGKVDALALAGKKGK